MNTSQTLFHFKKTRKQRSRLFINMALMCWFYIGILFGYEYVSQTRIDEPTRQIVLWVFFVSSIILLYIAWWHRRHPATYEARVTNDRVIVNYPGSTSWSFSVLISDIKRFESRKSLSHAGKGIAQHGVLLNDGTFHHISMNYGVSIGDIYKAVQSVRPEVPFPARVNKRVEGPLAKEYDN